MAHKDSVTNICPTLSNKWEVTKKWKSTPGLLARPYRTGESTTGRYELWISQQVSWLSRNTGYHHSQLHPLSTSIIRTVMLARGEGHPLMKVGAEYGMPFSHSQALLYKYPPPPPPPGICFVSVIIAMVIRTRLHPVYPQYSVERVWPPTWVTGYPWPIAFISSYMRAYRHMSRGEITNMDVMTSHSCLLILKVNCLLPTHKLKHPHSFD